MKLAPALAFGAAAGLSMFGVRATLATYQLVGSGDANAGYVAAAVLIAGLTIASIVATIAQFAYLTGRPGRTVPTGLALVALGVCAALLGPVTFFIATLIFAGACLYAVDAAAAGRGPADAIAESCRVALGAPGATATALAILTAGIVLGAVAGGLLGAVQPLAGDLLAGVIGQLAAGYVAPRVAATFLKLQSGLAGS